MRLLLLLSLPLLAAALFRDQVGVDDRVRAHVGPPRFAFASAGKGVLLATGAGALALAAQRGGETGWRAALPDGEAEADAEAAAAAAAAAAVAVAEAAAAAAEARGDGVEPNSSSTKGGCSMVKRWRATLRKIRR